MLDWREFSAYFRNQIKYTFLLFYVFHASPVVCIYAPAADCLHTKHVTTTGAPVRCPDSYVRCPDSYIRTMNLSYTALPAPGKLLLHGKRYIRSNMTT